ncbi:Transcription initiation factor TFIID subunit 13 [Borealophlyctis nickersoniae]|nr:Transcription initiation factor TFIID subunit 13 [Borealophlyctis nickersoniae]
MYGFGDVANPAKDTVDLMEEMLMIYFADLAAETNKLSPGNKIKLGDILHALRNDPKKLTRAQELIAMTKEIKDAKRLSAGPAARIASTSKCQLLTSIVMCNQFVSLSVRIQALLDEVVGPRKDVAMDRLETQKLLETVQTVLGQWETEPEEWKQQHPRFFHTLTVLQEAAAKRAFYEVLDWLEELFWRKTR